MTRVSVSAARGARNAAIAVIGGFAAVMASGCSPSLTGGGGDGTPTAALAPVPVQPQQQQTSKPVTFAPVIGAPAKVSTKINEYLVAQAGQKAMPVVPPKDAEYTIRGYLVAAPDPKGTKLSYIWDVSDKTNKRKRFQGEELIEGKKGGDPWAVVDDNAMQKVAAKAIEDISAYVPKGEPGQGPAPAGVGAPVPGAPPSISTAPTSAPIAPAPSGGGFSFSSLFGGGNSAAPEPAAVPAVDTAPASLTPGVSASSQPIAPAPAPVQVASLSNDTPVARQAVAQPRAAARPVAATPPASAPVSSEEVVPGAPAPRPVLQQTAAVVAGPVAVVPTVVGAPGDGSQSLTGAMRKHLKAAGVKLVDRANGPNVYTVNGAVELADDSAGQQKITIQWTVTDPSGKTLDKAVVQKNVIPQGSLDGAWGEIADMAAKEAARSVAVLVNKPAG